MKGLDALELLFSCVRCENGHNLEICSLARQTIKKELKALEIIKEKQVDVRMFIIYDLENYNRLQKNDYCKLTKAEDDLLKEVLL